MSEVEGLAPEEAKMVASWLREDGELPAEESPQEVTEAPVSTEGGEPDEVAWQSKAEQLQNEKDGILSDLRQVRSEMRAERSQNAESRRRLEERLEALSGALTANQGQADPAPDPNEDPLGHLVRESEATRGEIEALRGGLEAQQQQAAFTQQATEMLGKISAAEEQYLVDNDLDREVYEDALSKVRAGMSNYFNIQGHAPEEVAKAISNQEVVFANQVMANGGNPAAAIIQYATENFGWKPPEQESVSGNGDVPAFVPDPKIPATKTLSSVRGEARVGRKITLDDIENLTDEEFEAIVSNPNKWQALNTGGSVTL